MESGISWFLVYARACGSTWLLIYLAFSFLFGLVADLTLHMMVLGLMICLVTYFRLPAPNPQLARKVLGVQPKPEMGDTEVDWEVAHRAAGLDAPENSLEALRLAAKNGARVVEFDVSFTSDKTAVVFHDDTVDRVTQATGNITNLPFSSLKKLDLSVKHPLGAGFSGIPKLDDFVEECLRLKLKMIIDLKTYNVPEETTATVLDLYKRFPSMKSCTMVTSFFPNLLYRLRAADPDIVCSLSFRSHFVAYSTYEGISEGMKPRFSGMKFMAAVIMDALFLWALEHFLWYFLGLSAILVHKAMVTPEFVNTWRLKGVRVMAWTVNDPLEKAFLRYNLGVQSLTDTLEKVKPDLWVLKN